jgi:hypothetical protein
MRKHFAPYTPETVSRITGGPQDKFLKVCELEAVDRADPRFGSRAGDRHLDGPRLRGDLGAWHDQCHDPRLRHRRLGLAAPPQVAAQRGREGRKEITALVTCKR